MARYLIEIDREFSLRMPKRTNPFGDHTCLQLKTYVREKEVDRGINQQIRMKSVYERTQALLFTGMRQLHDMTSAPAVCSDIEIMDNEILHCKADNSSLKQLHLNSKCELVNGENEEMDTECRSSPLIVISSSRFGSNSQITNSDECQRPSFKPEISKDTFCILPQTNEKAFCTAGSSPLTKQMCNPFVLMKSAQSKMLSIEKSFLGVRACHNCRLPVQSKDVMKCQFCENYVCYPCIRQCSGCHLHFCHLCSVLNYDESVEKAYCLNCSGARLTDH
uniref:Apoptosis regulatory protein Siva n=2 Tax=Biomphalaria glabrata TaxID=6526 RepID=A0A2C9LW39_BIOGL